MLRALVRYSTEVWVILGMAAVVVVLVTTLWLNGRLTQRVERMVATPESVGLEAVTIPLTTADGLELLAWWVPAADPRGVVILAAGMAELDASNMLGQARFLHEAGHAALVLDLRAHGRSAGRRIGLAFEEPLDLAAALGWIAAQPELRHVPVALLGVSLGGAAALRTAAVRPDVAAVVSVSAFSSADALILDQVRARGAPDWVVRGVAPLVRVALRMLYRADPRAASPAGAIPAIPPRAILLIHGDADSRVGVAHALRLYEAAGGSAELWIVPGAEHGVYSGNGVGSVDALYRARIVSFFDGALGQQGGNGH